MSKNIPSAIREQLLIADQNRCAYCQTSAIISGQMMTVDHIVPVSKGGANTFNNLCLACERCNSYKHMATEAVDPVTKRSVPLFHPRQDSWHEHFAWEASGIYLAGLTDTGRATVIALRMNHPAIVVSRQIWVRVGWHPPI